jgi:hypothetical protein
MGCWNETCGLTQMPICGGDPVRMFLIVENAYPRGSRDVCISYGTELWRPFGLPLKGTYDEYGRLENIEEDCMSNFLLESLREMVVEVPNRMGDVFKREELDWPTAIDFIADEGLRVTDPFDVANITKKLDKILAEVREKVPNLPDNGWSIERSDMAKEQKKVVEDDPRVVTMYHMMVHEDVYQAVLNYKVPAERFSSWTDGDIKETMRQGAKDYIAQVRQDLADMAKMSEAEKAKFAFRLRLSREMYNNRFVSITNHLDGSYGSGSYLRKYLDFVEKRITEGAADDDPQIQALTEQFVGFAAFSQTMTLMRKLWMPQTGKGGQDREYVMHKYMGQVIADFSEKKIKEWDEMMGEYDDDSEEEDESTPEE